MTIRIEQLVVLTLAISAFLAVFSIVYEVVFPIWVYLLFLACLFSGVLIHLRRRNLLSAFSALPFPLVILVGLVVISAESLPSLARFPSYVLTSANVSAALGSMIIATSTFLFVTLIWGNRRHWNYSAYIGCGGRKRDAQLIWVFIFIALLIAFLTVPGTTILSSPYATAEQRTGRILDSAGLKIVGIALLSVALTMSAVLYRTKSKKHITVVLAALSIAAYFYFLRGDRGGALPVVVTLLLLYLMLSKQTLKKRLVLTTVFGIVSFVVLMMMSYFRATAATIGVMPAVYSSWEFAVGVLAGKDHADGYGLLRLPLLPQSFWHFLHVADLYGKGISLDGQSFFDLIPQSMPKFVTDIFQYDRPLNGAWRLAAYRIHGGGMNTAALAYWNLGWPGVVVFSIGLGSIINFLEGWYRRQMPAVIGTYALATASMPYVMLYGWQPFLKMLEIAFFLGLIIKYVVYGGRENRHVVGNAHHDNRLTRAISN